MASEDSDQLSPGLLAIHCLSDLGDVGQALKREMMTAIDERYAPHELLEVALLRRSHRVCGEEWDDHVDQVVPSPNHEAIQVFPVVVVALVAKHLTDTEELLQLTEARHALRALRHRELMSYLVAGSVAAPASTAWLADKTD